ncbi:DUF4241 domain-containing protein [Hymenobacter sp. GOD-10R]|uniref:DUF4241 domain-containing protein n=1 Tax=Hymenobacter sp. GOD-10R TaxID=3093922 RepID=UPI002D78C459|nr:DUF4241 domain-containing protein [Hymenobacter sp. GOD-10R]WRQ31012.1 DUF4241 domain-containing protein [Hymenobacter sp. GOD-10R]
MRSLYVLLLLASVLFISCSQDKNKFNLYESGVIAPIQPTIKCQPYQVTARPILFESSFFPNIQIQQDSITLHLDQRFLGNLPVSSGRIVATDPVALRDTPFTTIFPHGRFPVELAIAHFDNDARVAFARVVFSNEPVATWQMALVNGQELLPITGETYYGYSVDAGIALFMDAAHIHTFNQYLSSDQSASEKLFINSFKLDSDSPLPGLLYAANGDTLATFSTGWGDGSYATYIGLDAQNKPCRLLTDFQVIDWH